MEKADGYRLFGLKPGATLAQIKAVYRRLAKQYHPDRSADEAGKPLLAEKMASINTAYEILCRDCGLSSQAEPVTGKPADDTALYKQAAAIYNFYSGSIRLKFKDVHTGLESLEEKLQKLDQTKALFRELLENYPDSDWAPDSAEKLETLERAWPNLLETIEFVRTHQLTHTKKGTPVWKKK